MLNLKFASKKIILLKKLLSLEKKRVSQYVKEHFLFLIPNYSPFTTSAGS